MDEPDTMSAPRKVLIRTEDCVQCGSCYGALPAVYGADDDGTAFVHDSLGGSISEIQSTLDQCAGGCILWGSEIKKSPL